MHPGPCDLLHLPKKICRGSPSPENFFVICSLIVLMRYPGKWTRAVSYVCHYSNMSIHMTTLAHPAGRVPPGDAT
jgi:hypothetical protein